MKRILAITICCVFLISGIARVGVGAMLVGLAAGWWTVDGEAGDVLGETQRFIAEREFNIVQFTPITYFTFILFMGLAISIGAVGQLWRKRWGLGFIGLYLLCHAGLFVNFMTLNRKVIYLVGAALLTVVLYWANKPTAKRSELGTNIEAQ